MTLIKRNHSFPFFPSFFDDEVIRRFNNWPGTMVNHTSIPAVNILETQTEFQFEIAAPGMKKEDFNVEFSNHVLTISSVKKTVEENNEKNYSRREFNYSVFKRSFAIAAQKIDFSRASGKYEDGILHIVIPKRIEEQENVSKLNIE